MTCFSINKTAQFKIELCMFCLFAFYLIVDNSDMFIYKGELYVTNLIIIWGSWYSSFDIKVVLEEILSLTLLEYYACKLTSVDKKKKGNINSLKGRTWVGSSPVHNFEKTKIKPIKKENKLQVERRRRVISSQKKKEGSISTLS